MPTIDKPYEMGLCQFCQSIQGNNVNYCFAYAWCPDYQDKHWSEYPQCSFDICPYIHKEILDKIKMIFKGYSVYTPWGAILQFDIHKCSLLPHSEAIDKVKE